MKRLSLSVGVATLLATTTFGQSPATPPAFELADVHVSKRVSQNMGGGAIRGGRYELRNATMVDLITTAYEVTPERVLGGPNWLELDRFDVITKVPNGATIATVRPMLKALLADRFKLALHEDTKPLTQYAMTVVGGKPKIKEASAGAPGGCQAQNQPQANGMPMAVATCRNITMAAFADLITRNGTGYINNPILDRTGLAGGYDFEFRFTPRAVLAQSGSDGISLFDALESQLGLKLDLQQIPASALVVDRVDRTPTANPPEVARGLPTPPPPEFEVAELKPSPPDAPGPRAQLTPTGQLNAVGVPVRMLITVAWDIQSDEMLVGPKWMDETKFDVIAKAFSGPTQQQQVDDDVLRQMVQALVIDRFKLKFHFEDRPVTAYRLTSVKPKMTKSDPNSRTKCSEGPPPGVRDPRLANPILTRLLSCQNMTMAQLAERLPRVANGYVQTAVLDATGLEGGWDFMLNFSPIGVFRQAAQNRVANGQSGTSAADPTGALSLAEAIDRQLGLKLDTEKRPMPVFVVDHIDEKPTDN